MKAQLESDTRYIREFWTTQTPEPIYIFVSELLSLSAVAYIVFNIFQKSN